MKRGHIVIFLIAAPVVLVVASNLPCNKAIDTSMFMIGVMWCVCLGVLLIPIVSRLVLGDGDDRQELQSYYPANEIQSTVIHELRHAIVSRALGLNVASVMVKSDMPPHVSGHCVSTHDNSVESWQKAVAVSAAGYLKGDEGKTNAPYEIQELARVGDDASLVIRQALVVSLMSGRSFSEVIDTGIQQAREIIDAHREQLDSAARQITDLILESGISKRSEWVWEVSWEDIACYMEINPNFDLTG